MIKEITYHVLLKEQGATKNARVDINPNTLPVTDSSDELLKQLNERYRGRAGKGYGTFHTDRLVFPTSQILENYLDINHPADFSKTTELLMSVLQKEINIQAGATGGKIAFIHYEDAGIDYFLVALLSEKVGLIARNWDLRKEDILNIDNMRFAGRINLTDWQDANCNNRYISFLKGQGEVSEYFKRFMGCDDALQASIETKNLITLIEIFANEQGLDFDQSVKFKNESKEYLENLSNAEDLFSLQAFTNRVWPQDPQVLIDSIEANGTTNNIPIADGFIPDKRSLKKLVIFKHRARHWSMSFDSEAIRNGDIEYRNGNIILTNPPADLISPFT